MRLLSSPPKPSSRQVSVAAEAIAAAQFALYGFDVLEQAGRTRFSHDLGVAQPGGMMKVTVHGSLGGFWDLVDAYLEKPQKGIPSKAEYHRAIDKWAASYSRNVACCLVQFYSDDLGTMPRIYLASAAEIASRLHASTELLGDSALYEQYEVTDAEGYQSLETLPADWRFSTERIEQLMEAPLGKPPLEFRFSAAARCTACSAVHPATCVNCLPMMN